MLGQFPAEIRWLASKIEGATSLIEIGSFKGESLQVLAGALAPRSRVYSVDLPGGPCGNVNSIGALRSMLKSLRMQGHATYLYEGASSDAQPLAEIPSDIDVLFIDGDHSYEGVKFDYEFYGTKVMAGGLIAFHDIRSAGLQVSRFWQEIVAANPGRTEEFWVKANDKGIGILRK